LADHPLQANVTVILTSQNSHTPKRLESWLSVRICRNMAEL
jgi:hypothetical protein